MGRMVFAAVFVALGILGLAKGDFAPIWQPVPKGAPVREALVYLSAIVSLACGAGLLWKRTAAPAARVLLALLLIWFALFRAPVIFHAPSEVVTWEGCGETVVMVAGAWALYANLAAGWERRRLGFATGERGLRIARTLFGLAMVAFGAAHFAYVKDTASLVPSWLPGHLAWVYFTGGAYVAAGLAVLTGVLARLGAALAALQMGLFTLLVWAPMLAAGAKGAFQWSETIVSAALTAGGWVIADTYRGAPWLALKARSRDAGFSRAA